MGPHSASQICQSLKYTQWMHCLKKWLGYNPVIWSHPDESADLWIHVSFDVPQWWMLTWRPKTWSRHHFPVVKGGEPLPAMVLRTCEVPVMALGAHLFEESIYQGAWLTLVLHLSAEEVSRDMSNLLHQPSHSVEHRSMGKNPWSQGQWL